MGNKNAPSAESYADSVRAVVKEQQIEVATLARMKELVFLRRQQGNLFEIDALERRKRESRVRGALQQMRRAGECALIDKAKYRFFI